MLPKITLVSGPAQLRQWIVQPRLSAREVTAQSTFCELSQLGYLLCVRIYIKSGLFSTMVIFAILLVFAAAFGFTPIKEIESDVIAFALFHLSNLIFLKFFWSRLGRSLRHYLDKVPIILLIGLFGLVNIMCPSIVF